MTDHIRTKRKLREISRISDLVELLDACTLTEEDKDIIKMLYIERQTMTFIADKLGYSESAIKKRHKRILNKINKML